MSDCSATALRGSRTGRDTTVTPASTSVPPADARAEIVTQSAMQRVYGGARKPAHTRHGSVVKVEDMDVRTLGTLASAALRSRCCGRRRSAVLLVRHLGGGGSAAPAVTPVQPAVQPKATAPKIARGRRRRRRTATGALSAASPARGSTTRSRSPAARPPRRSSTRSTSRRRSPTGSRSSCPGRGVASVAAAGSSHGRLLAVRAARPELGHARAAREPAGHRAGDGAEDPRLPAAARRVSFGRRATGGARDRPGAHGPAERARDPVR